MPSPFRIGREDLLRSKVVQPGWYPALIKSVTTKPAKTDGSLNTTIHCVIQGGAFDGVPVDRLFSEKAPGFAENFVVAVTGAPVDPDQEYDFERAVGKEVMIYVKNREWQGRLTNDIADFKAKS